MVSFGEAEVRPRNAPIHRFVNAVAPGRALAIVGFARSHPHDIAIARGDTNVANGNGCFVIKLMLKTHAVVFCLQQPAGRSSKPEEAAILIENRNRNDAAAHVARANGAATS